MKISFRKSAVFLCVSRDTLHCIKGEFIGVEILVGTCSIWLHSFSVCVSLKNIKRTLKLQNCVYRRRRRRRRRTGAVYILCSDKFPILNPYFSLTLY